MMDVKGGTQTWSTAAQTVSQKSDKTQNLSAIDRQKYFADEDLGETLNKVADPNFAATQKTQRKVGNNELGKDAFMTLLLTQMKNQDPTSPLKSHEMAAQLAQFTSLEKLNNINDSIGELRKDQKPGQNFQALSMIGKTVNMDNSKIVRNDSTESHELRFSLPVDAQKAVVKVQNEAGDVIREIEVRNLKAGSNSVPWNGQTDESLTAPAGNYTMVVEATGSNGKKLQVQTKAEGMITGVNFTAQGAQLMMGKNSISLSEVKSISDPIVEQSMMAMAAQAEAPKLPKIVDGEAESSSSVQSPKKVEIKTETKGNEEKRARLSKGTINDSAMAGALVNKLNKEGAKAGMEEGI